MNAFVKHIAPMVACCAVLCAGALQYTHDVSHGDDAESCSLCWFIQHQMAGDIGPLPNVIDPHTEPVSVGQNTEYAVFIPLRFILRESNKDPPGSFAQKNPKTQSVTHILSAI